MKKSKTMKHTTDMVASNVTLGLGNVVLGQLGAGPIKGTGMMSVVSSAGYAKIAMDEASKIGKKK